MTELCEQRIPAGTYDIDFAGIVSNIAFARWLEDIRLGPMQNARPLTAGEAARHGG